MTRRPITFPAIDSGKLILVRHGQTDGNVQRLMLGSRTNPPLNDRGRAQAHRLSGQLQDCGGQQIFASDMRRASETARIIASRLDLPMHVTPNLRESDHGILDGLPMDEPSQAAEFSERKRLKGAYRPPGGESCLDVAGRITGWLVTHRRELENRTTIVVCHLGVIRGFALALTGLRSKDALFWQDHDQVSMIDFHSRTSSWSIPPA